MNKQFTKNEREVLYDVLDAYFSYCISPSLSTPIAECKKSFYKTFCKKLKIKRSLPIEDLLLQYFKKIDSNIRTLISFWYLESFFVKNINLGNDQVDHDVFKIHLEVLTTILGIQKAFFRFQTSESTFSELQTYWYFLKENKLVYSV